jgi:arginine/lysine/ornithine decarboxylase
LGDIEPNLLRLAAALNAIDRTLGTSAAQASPSAPIPQKAMPIHMAAKVSTEFVPIEQSAGRISGDFLWAYPPGIPLTVPGEVIDEGLLAYLNRSADMGVDISAAKNSPDGMLRVLKNT